ncbi:uncharacterized protein LOC132053036 [Lycium ferocissimum]|uniref:uncharacterized protein LOC132053036 n=1 Tax=Lycium ferocissimum TaxID=112874 RepID=UPI0028168B88|nr:uncharacterized protein LOC132053036 [Lycium ferocissimum]
MLSSIRNTPYTEESFPGFSFKHDNVKLPDASRIYTTCSSVSEQFKRCRWKGLVHCKEFQVPRNFRSTKLMPVLITCLPHLHGISKSSYVVVFGMQKTWLLSLGLQLIANVALGYAFFVFEDINNSYIVGKVGERSGNLLLKLYAIQFISLNNSVHIDNLERITSYVHYVVLKLPVK